MGGAAMKVTAHCIVINASGVHHAGDVFEATADEVEALGNSVTAIHDGDTDTETAADETAQEFTSEIFPPVEQPKKRGRPKKTED